MKDFHPNIEIVPFKLKKSLKVDEYFSAIIREIDSVDPPVILAPIDFSDRTKTIKELINCHKQFSESAKNSGREVIFYGLDYQELFVCKANELNVISTIWDLYNVTGALSFFTPRPRKLKSTICEYIAFDLFNELIYNNIVPNKFLSQKRNLAHNCKVIPTNSWNSAKWNNSLLTDGNIYSLLVGSNSPRGWRSENYDKDTSLTLTVDLNSINEVQEVILFPTTLKGTDFKQMPDSLVVECSSNNIDWIPVHGKIKKPKGRIYYVFDDSINARYIKLRFDNLCHSDKEGYFLSFSELEVYGNQN